MDETITWIDVDKDVPDDSIDVLVYLDPDDLVWIGYWDSESYTWRVADGTCVETVTHWAEMPEGPKP